jgi:TetR/AcrR family transcriptional regulator, regulator of cefoperazone and chloramphenicol sensitivity
MSRSDETRARLLEAGRQLFAERGFKKVTVRDICREAEANVAAVNYHFQDKEGLYRAIVEQGIALISETTEAGLRAPAGATAEERLHTFIRTAVGRMGAGQDNWIARLLRYEIDNPTGALDQLVERAIGPRLQALASLVADVLGCEPDDPRVARSVASIHVQLMLVVRPWRALGERLRLPRAPSPDELGTHIAEFSIGGLQALRDGRAAQEAGRTARSPRKAASRKP